MPLMPIAIPPGVYRNGTELQSAGRWFDANLVRWYEGTMRPIRGWRTRSDNAITGLARGLLAWTDNSHDKWVAAGTAAKLYVWRVDGALADITPSGFTAGLVDGTEVTGYGYGVYGSQEYGIARRSLGSVAPATTWSMDTWGEYLIACSDYDGKIYEWQLNFSTPIAAQLVANAPTGCNAVLVTSERIVMALGAGGNPRKVQWSDQEDNTTWTPTTLNQAGDFELVTPGQLMAGKRCRGLQLLWTDVDLHVAQYIGLPFVYSFEKIGAGCGLIGKQAVAIVADTSAYWMSASGFWVYDGSVRPLPSDVGDYVFSNINGSQSSKVYSVHNSSFGEVWWFYPSANSTEVDSYVLYNYRENHWSIGQLGRTCGTGAGAFTTPLMLGVDGYLYEHEIGLIQAGDVYAATGPIQIGAGDQVMSVREVVPDELNQGDAELSFTTKLYPNADATTHGPYSTANPTSVRFTGRQVQMRVTQTKPVAWRVGTMRLDAVAGSRR